MTKAEFYNQKRIVEIEWWLGWASLPDLAWARLRVFDDGMADSTFGPESKLYGFVNREFAGYLLSEDEYRPLWTFDAGDESEHGIHFSKLLPPVWPEDPNSPFDYLGTY